MDDVSAIETVERELRRSLQHIPAPNGFTDRVMAHVAGRERRARTPVLRGTFASIRPVGAWWAGIAAALLMVVGGGDALHVRHQRQAREAEVVQAQIDMAMQLTSHALNEVQVGFDHSPAGKFSQLWQGREK